MVTFGRQKIRTGSDQTYVTFKSTLACKVSQNTFNFWVVVAVLSGWLLPPANEVWGKVIFLHQFVILFTGGACMVAPWGACMVLFGECVVLFGGCVLALGGHAWLLWGACMVLFGGGMRGFIWGACMVLFGGCVVLFGGMCACSGGMRGFIWGACMVLFGGHAWFYLGGMHVFFSFSDTMRYGQWMGGTHPTGMHSCSIIVFNKNAFK